MSARAYRNYIEGKWTDAASGETYALPNPATEETVAIVPDAGSFPTGPCRRHKKTPPGAGAKFR